MADKNKGSVSTSDGEARPNTMSIAEIIEWSGPVFGAMDALENKRDVHRAQIKAINKKIKAEREQLVARGLSRHAIADARAYAELSDEAQDNYDRSYAMVRAAIGAPAQMDLDLEAAFMPPEVVAQEAAGAQGELDA